MNVITLTMRAPKIYSLRAMKFGIFYEHQLPRPWSADSEYRLLHESLAQIELADGLGYDYAWEVEHHFLEEYSHSSAPEVFLGAASQRTRRIRLGHGVIPLPTRRSGSPAPTSRPSAAPASGAWARSASSSSPRRLRAPGSTSTTST